MVKVISDCCLKHVASSPSPSTRYWAWPLRGPNHTPHFIKNLKTIIPRVVYTILFWLKRSENLVPMCKPKRKTPLFHLGKISAHFDEFRSFGPISAGLLFGENWAHCNGPARLQLPHISDCLRLPLLLLLLLSFPSPSSSSFFVFSAEALPTFPFLLLLFFFFFVFSAKALSLTLYLFFFFAFFSFLFWFECPSHMLVVPFLLCTFLV